MKTLYTILIGLILSLNVYSHEYSLTLTEPGTLSTEIKDDVYYTAITDLTIDGEMNAKDFRFIKDNLTVLWYLDISNVNIHAVTTINGTNPKTQSTVYNADEIPMYCFENSVLKEISIPNSCTSIGLKAFNLCTELTNIDFGTSQITTFNKFTISNCHAFTSFTIPESVLYINYQAFAGCSFETLTLHNNIKDIFGDAFFMCDNIKTINIGFNIPVNGEPFSDLVEQNAKLVISDNYYDITDISTYWSNFVNIINDSGDTPTSIDEIKSNRELVAIYSLYGRLMPKNRNMLKSGIYIFKYNDNSTEKIYVRN